MELSSVLPAPAPWNGIPPVNWCQVIAAYQHGYKDQCRVEFSTPVSGSLFVTSSGAYATGFGRHRVFECDIGHLTRSGVDLIERALGSWRDLDGTVIALPARFDVGRGIGVPVSSRAERAAALPFP